MKAELYCRMPWRNSRLRASVPVIRPHKGSGGCSRVGKSTAPDIQHMPFGSSSNRRAWQSGHTTFMGPTLCSTTSARLTPKALRKGPEGCRSSRCRRAPWSCRSCSVNCLGAAITPTVDPRGLPPCGVAMTPSSLNVSSNLRRTGGLPPCGDTVELSRPNDNPDGLFCPRSHCHWPAGSSMAFGGNTPPPENNRHVETSERATSNRPGC